MSYKTVLVQLDDGKACGERTQVAIDLAQAFDAHLIGFYSVDPYRYRATCADWGTRTRFGESACCGKTGKRPKPRFGSALPRPD